MKRELSVEKKMSINEKVLTLLKEYDIDLKESINVVELAQKMGFSLYVSKMDESDDGFILVDKRIKAIPEFDTNKIICVNRDREYVDRRFIVAHEIAHYVLNDKQEIYAHRETSTKHDKNEEDADYFAACLLMIADIFKEKFNKLTAQGFNLDEIVKALAVLFEVREKSVYKRIIELNLNSKLEEVAE